MTAASLAPVPTSQNRTPLTADLLTRVVSARDLDKQDFTPPIWLWHGYLAPGKVTLLTSQWKSGKTTLLSILLARLQLGGQLAGLSVAPARVLVISEESEADWRDRFLRLGIRDHVQLLCRPFPAQPGHDRWLALIDTADVMRRRDGTSLLGLLPWPACGSAATRGSLLRAAAAEPTTPVVAFQEDRAALVCACGAASPRARSTKRLRPHLVLDRRARRV